MYFHSIDGDLSEEFSMSKQRALRLAQVAVQSRLLPTSW
jgi:hypothetical protein